MPNKKQEEIYRKSYDQLCSYLNEHKLRPTQERLCVLSSICSLQRFTIDDLRYAISDIHISRATVYNTIDLFEKAGVIRHIEKEYGVRAGQYELTCIRSSTVQIICQLCGRISEVKDSTISRMLEDKRFSNFNQERYSLYIYGKCKKCRKKTNISQINKTLL